MTEHGHLIKIDANASVIHSNDVSERLLTSETFHRLRDVPTLIEWLANITLCRDPCDFYSHRLKSLPDVCFGMQHQM